MSLMRRVYILTVTLSAFIGSIFTLSPFSDGAFAHQGATGIVKERMDRFDQSRDALKASFAELKAGQFDAIITNARAMAQWGRDMPSFFPEGSDGAPSEAAPAIWQDKAGFAAAAKAFADAADHVIITAQTKDTADTGAALKKLAGTCGDCHRQYRLK